MSIRGCMRTKSRTTRTCQSYAHLGVGISFRTVGVVSLIKQHPFSNALVWFFGAVKASPTDPKTGRRVFSRGTRAHPANLLPSILYGVNTSWVSIGFFFSHPLLRWSLTKPKDPVQRTSYSIGSLASTSDITMWGFVVL